MSLPKAIILAAGQGTRLRPLTDDIPKCMVKVNGKPILEWQLEVMESNGLHDITVVTGYKENRITDPRVKKVFNKDYQSTNMVYSLMCAEEDFNGEVVVAYGDIIYSKKVLEQVLAATGDIVLASDELWQQYWEKRCEDPLSDAESFITGPGQTVKSLGQKATSTDQVQGQFTGLMKFSPKGTELLKKTYYQCRENSTYAQNCWDSGRKLKKAYMTDILNFLAQNSLVSYIAIQRGWFEVDAPQDLEIAESKFEEIIKPSHF